MNVPGIVQSTLEGEEIATRVSLGGEDELFVTPSRTIVYRADGLLSNESVDEYGHDADRLTISEGRRKARFSLEYALDGTEEFTVPAGHVDEVLHPVLAGLLNGNGITDPGESVRQTYRFSELTLIITSDRLVKHVGAAVWDGDYEGYHYDDVTRLSFEDGSVATTIVLEVDGRQQRIKAPSEDATEVGERLKRALFAYHDVETLAELNETVGEDEPEESREDPSTAFGDGVDPLDADPPESDAADSGDGRGDPLADRSGAGERPAAEASASSASTSGGSGGSEADTRSTDRESGRAARSGPSAEAETPPTNGSADERGASGPDIGDDPTGSARSPTAESADSTAPTAEAAASSGETVTSTGADSASGLSSPPANGERESTGERGSTAERASDDERQSTTSEPAATDDTPSSNAAADDASDSFEGSGFEPATSSADAALLERLDALEETVERQSTLLEKQQRTIETLIEELRQGR